MIKKRPLQKAFKLWYYDCTAKALMNSYKAFTHFITASKSINMPDDSLLKPGDIAVTKGGIHVLESNGYRPIPANIKQ